MRAVLLPLFLFAHIGLMAQHKYTESKGNPAIISNQINLSEGQNSRALICKIDTIEYTTRKENFLGTQKFYSIPTVGPNRVSAQGYFLDNPISVHGAKFLAAANTPTTIIVYLYASNNDYQPLSILDSTFITVSNLKNYYAAFSTPTLVGNNFSIGLRNPTTDTLLFYTNNASSATYGEGSGWRKSPNNVWLPNEAVYTQDLEWLISPVISYSNNPSFTIDADTTCRSTPFNLSNTTDYKISNNRMFTLNGFNKFWMQLSDSTFSWRIGNTSSLSYDNTVNKSASLNSSGINSISLIQRLQGYYSSCSDSAIGQIFIGPTPVLSISSFNTSNCGNLDGYASVLASGGTSTYSYLWDDASLQTSDTAFGLPFGFFTVKVTDVETNCFATKGIQVNEDGAATISFTTSDVTCNGKNDGTALITSSDDISSYTFTWSHGQSGQSMNSLNAGNYTVNGTNGTCSTIGNFSVSQPNRLKGNFNVGHVSCNGFSNGNVTTNPSGGIPPYGFLWSGGYTTPTVSNLAAGIYYLTLSDSKACSVLDSVTINEPQAITLVDEITNNPDSGQNNGSIKIIIEGGTPPYNINWSPISGNADSLVNLGPGTFQVSITDAKGCLKIASYTLVNAVGINPFTSDFAKIYPNPFIDKINIQLNDEVACTSIKLINFLGETIFESSVKNNKLITIDSLLNNYGPLFLIIHNGTQQRVYKLIK